MKSLHEFDIESGQRLGTTRANWGRHCVTVGPPSVGGCFFYSL
jgi:hypothetical protein